MAGVHQGPTVRGHGYDQLTMETIIFKDHKKKTSTNKAKILTTLKRQVSPYVAPYFTLEPSAICPDCDVSCKCQLTRWLCPQKTYLL